VYFYGVLVCLVGKDDFNPQFFIDNQVMAIRKVLGKEKAIIGMFWRCG